MIAALQGPRYTGPRKDFLDRQLRAVDARIDLLTGVRRSFSEESRLLFGVDPPAPPTRERIAAARAALERLVPGRGDLTRRVAEFQRRFIVPPDRLPAAFSRALAECRAVTLRHIALPADERVEVEYVADSPWTAFTRYIGEHRSRIAVNASIAFTVDEVLDLACHEGYPGHHVIAVLVDDALVRREGREELAVQPLFSPQTLLDEGAAATAPQMAFTDEERLAFDRSSLSELAGVSPPDESAIEVARLLQSLDDVRVDIARRYADGALEFARAAAALEHDAVMPSAVAMLKFVNEFRSLAVAYARGPELAAAWLDAHASRGDRAGRWRAYVQLVTNPSQAFEQK